MAKKTAKRQSSIGTRARAEVQAYYEDNGWKATISKYRIAPKDLSVLLGKKKAKKKAAKKSAKKKAAGVKKSAKKKASKKKAPTAKKKASKKRGSKKKTKSGRKPNPLIIIRRMEEELTKLKSALEAA